MSRRPSRAAGAQIRLIKHGVYGISGVVVMFGNPSNDHASRDISGGVRIFTAAPDFGLSSAVHRRRL